jgi:hypothetical protein
MVCPIACSGLIKPEAQVAHFRLPAGIVNQVRYSLITFFTSSKLSKFFFECLVIDPDLSDFVFNSINSDVVLEHSFCVVLSGQYGWSDHESS